MTRQKKTTQYEEGLTRHTVSVSTITIATHGGFTDPTPRSDPRTIKPRTLNAGRGRPRVWGKERLQLLIVKLVADHWKRKYRAPTLPQLATAIDAITPMREDAFRKLIQRYGLKWSELKRKPGP